MYNNNNNNNFLPSLTHFRRIINRQLFIILSILLPPLIALFDNNAERRGSFASKSPTVHARACTCVGWDRAGSLSRLARSGTILGRDNSLTSEHKRQGVGFVSATRRTRLFHDLARRNTNNFGEAKAAGCTLESWKRFLLGPLCYSVHSSRPGIENREERKRY